jgi:hypothetical protein
MTVPCASPPSGSLNTSRLPMCWSPLSAKHAVHKSGSVFATKATEFESPRGYIAIRETSPASVQCPQHSDLMLGQKRIQRVRAWNEAHTTTVRVGAWGE